MVQFLLLACDSSPSDMDKAFCLLGKGHDAVTVIYCPPPCPGELKRYYRNIKKTTRQSYNDLYTFWKCELLCYAPVWQPQREADDKVPDLLQSPGLAELHIKFLLPKCEMFLILQHGRKECFCAWGVIKNVSFCSGGASLEPVGVFVYSLR